MPVLIPDAAYLSGEGLRDVDLRRESELHCGRFSRIDYRCAYDVLRLRMRLFAHLPIKKVRRWGRVGRLVRNAFYTPVVIVVIVVVVVDMATPPDDSSIIASTGHRRPGPSQKREGFQTPHADMQTMQAAVQSG